MADTIPWMIARLWHRHLARPHVWAALFLLLVAAIPFWPFFLEAKAFLPTDILYTLPPWDQEQLVTGVHNPLPSDAIRVYYPWLTFAHDAVRDGVLPLWNPFIFSGAPHLANSLTATFYPLAALVYVLPVWLAYTLQGFIHVFLAGLFMFLYLRKVRLGIGASLFGAVAFMFNGFFVGWLQFGNFLYSGAWLPLALLFTEIVVEKQRLTAALLFAVILAIPLYGGHAQVAYYFLLGAGSYWLFRAGSSVLSASPGARLSMAVRLAYLSFLVWGGAFLLSTAQLLPSLELSDLTGRQRETLETYSAQAIPPVHLVTLLMPDFLGNPVSGLWWGKHNYSETSMYVGVWPLLLVGVAVFFRRDQYVWFFLGAAVLALAVAMGFKPLLWLLLEAVPLLDRFRAPGRFVYLADTALAVLGAFGFQALFEWKNRARVLERLGPYLLPAAAGTVVIAVLTFLVAYLPFSAYEELVKSGGFRYFREGMTYGELLQFEWLQVLRFALLLLAGTLLLFALRRRLLSVTMVVALFLAMTVTDLTFGATRYVTFTDPALLDRRPAAVVTLQRDPELYRIARFEGSFLAFTPNYPSVYGLYDTQGSSSYVLKSYLEFLGLTRPQSVTANEAENISGLPALKSKLINLMNVKYVIASVPIVDPQFTAVPTEGLLLYQNRDWLPRAFLVPRADVVPPEAMLSRLAAPDFDPTKAVLLERDSVPYGREGPASDSEVEILVYEPNKVLISVRSPSDGYLVLSDTYYPGWRVNVDGQRADVLKAFHTFRAVHLKSGAHLVEFAFEPASHRIGAWISGGTALAIVLIVAGQHVFHLVRRQRKKA